MGGGHWEKTHPEDIRRKNAHQMLIQNWTDVAEVGTVLNKRLAATALVLRCRPRASRSRPQTNTSDIPWDSQEGATISYSSEAPPCDRRRYQPPQKSRPICLARVNFIKRFPLTRSVCLSVHVSRWLFVRCLAM